MISFNARGQDHQSNELVIKRRDMMNLLEFLINSYLKEIILFIQLILSRGVVKFAQSCT